MTPCRFSSESKPTISWIWVSNPTSGESSDARSARPVRVGAYTSWEASSKKGMTFCQHQPPCHPPCTSTNVAILASFLTDWTLTESKIVKKDTISHESLRQWCRPVVPGLPCFSLLVIEFYAYPGPAAPLVGYPSITPFPYLLQRLSRSFHAWPTALR